MTSSTLSTKSAQAHSGHAQPRTRLAAGIPAASAIR
jgi:hypothetical protein